MNNMNILSALPNMQTGSELRTALSVLPEYHEDIRNENAAVRLTALLDIYNIYLPSSMSVEIYSKLYLALLRSLQKKTTKTAILQQNLNYRAIQQQSCNGIIGGSDSFTIIGTSGIGKSSAINRAIGLLTVNGIIETSEPYRKIIPCVIVQCPFDSSVKGLLLEILRNVDEAIGSNYYKSASKVRVTTDMLIGSVSQVAINHIGLLVVDEIQNVVNSKHGSSLVAMLTQLINNSGISICMVGTPESSTFFEQAIQLARRSLGLQYGALIYDDYFYDFCHTVFSYQYTRNKTEITDSIVEWLYEHSGGIVSVVISLIHDAQEIAILTGSERLDIDTLNEAYKKRLSFLHGYIEPSIQQGKQTTTNKSKGVAPIDTLSKIVEKQVDRSISEIVAESKSTNTDIVILLREYMTVEEVSV